MPKDGTAKGGNYLAVHMRRGDFLFSGRKGVPSIKAVRMQIVTLLKKLNLNKVFLATDAEDKGKRIPRTTPLFVYFQAASFALFSYLMKKYIVVGDCSCY